MQLQGLEQDDTQRSTARPVARFPIEYAVRVARGACYVLLAAALAGFALISRHYFMRVAPVWPDEALFAAPARDLLHGGPLRLPLLEGLLPSVERGTYLMPPTYLATVAGAFAIFGERVEVMRGVGVVSAWAVLLTSYGLARRYGLSRPLAALVPALLALDPVFERGARIGRMDMMALLCWLGALYVAARPDTFDARRTAFWSGLLAGFAMSVHPIAAASTLVVAMSALSRPGKRSAVWLCIAGGVVGVLPWALWIARDPQAYMAQWVPQFTRKAENWKAYGPEPWFHAYEFVRNQYPEAIRPYVRPLYVGAAAGYLFTSVLRPRVFVLSALYVLMFVSVLTGAEMWYCVHLTPLVSLGLVLPLSTAWPKRAPVYVRRMLATAVLGALGFVVYLGGTNIERDYANKRRGMGYRQWSSQIIGALPANARILIAAIPDPYFATIKRPDLKVREFLPTGIPLSEEASNAVIASTDFVVTGSVALTPWVDTLLRERGQLLGMFGMPGDENFGMVFAIRH